MEIDRETVVGFLRERGEQDKAEQAGRELPERVDTERDGDLLSRFGVDPADLLGKFTGGRDIPGL